MPVIYEPAGKAREYAELAANLWRGCSHACAYCYAPAVLRMSRADFACPAPRKDVLAELAKDCRRYAHDPRRVLFCFTSDPYQPMELQAQLMRIALPLLAGNGLRADVLTKGGDRCRRDFDLFLAGDVRLGATLTGDDALSAEWEPGAAPNSERIAVLRDANAAGIYTWASIEPVIHPAQSLAAIRATMDFVDHFKVGKLNHDPAREAMIDWGQFLADVESLLSRHRGTHYIKADLARHRRNT